MNCTILYGSEKDITYESVIPIKEIPDYLLDEWATNFKDDPIQEIGLGTYYILEGDSPTPNLMKKKENMEGLWSLYFDGSRNRNVYSVGIMLISPDLVK